MIPRNVFVGLMPEATEGMHAPAHAIMFTAGLNLTPQKINIKLAIVEVTCSGTVIMHYYGNLYIVVIFNCMFIHQLISTVQLIFMVDHYSLLVDSYWRSFYCYQKFHLLRSASFRVCQLHRGLITCNSCGPSSKLGLT